LFTGFSPENVDKVNFGYVFNDLIGVSWRAPEDSIFIIRGYGMLEARAN
jgi:hypothetical protein